MICASRPVPSVVTTRAWVSPRVNSAEPWVRASTPVRMLIGRTVLLSRPSIRGWPSRIRWRTSLCSRLKNSVPTSSLVNFGASPVVNASSSEFFISLILACRCCFSVKAYAAARLVSAKVPTACFSSVISAGAAQDHFGFPASAASSLMAFIATCICSWPNVTAPSMTSSFRPAASDSTISTPSAVPATTRSSCDSPSWVAVGFKMYLPSLYPTRTAPMGPMNGRPEMASAAEAPSREAMSGSTSELTDNTEATTCTSLVNPSGNSGRIGRSINRDVRVSFSVGRPSRLKNPPGMRPAA